MMWCNAVRLFAAALLYSAGPVPAQAPIPIAAPPSSVASAASPKAQFFAGTVVELKSDHITVSRDIVGRPPEKRTFRINRRTKMSRALRVKSRVTVRYQHLPEGDVALEIQLRPVLKTSQPS
jgi:hypothetical protein